MANEQSELITILRNLRHGLNPSVVAVNEKLDKAIELAGKNDNPLQNIRDSKIDMGDDFDEVIDEHRHPHKDLLLRAEKSLSWMVKVLKWQHDDTGISPGNYSELLTEASNLLDEIKKANK